MARAASKVRSAPTRTASAPGAPSATPVPRWLLAALAAVVLAAAIVPYVRTLDYDFVWDDGFVIGPHLDIHGPSDLARLWNLPFDNLLKDEVMTRTYFRPAVLFSFALDRAVYGQNAHGFHQTNLVLYAATCWFLWLFAWQLTRRPVAAALGAVLFALHPAHPESVAFVSGRTDVLAALFFYASLWAAVRFGPSIRAPLWKLLPASLILIPGLYAKEVAFFGAPVLVIALWVRDRRLSARDIAVAAVPVAAACALYLATRFAVLGPHPMPAFSPVEGTTTQILTSVAVVARYLPLLFMPVKLSARHEIVEVHAPDVVFLAGLLTLAAIGVGLWVTIRRRSLWAAPLALFAFTLLPTCYVKLLSGAIVAERFLFVASGAIAAGVAALDAGAAVLLAGSAAAVWFAFLLWPRVAVWKDEGTLFTSMLRDSPESPHVHAIVAGWYYKQRDLERAAYHYRRAIRYAPDREAELLLNLGATEDEMGQIDSAFVHVRRLNALRPDWGVGWYALGNLYVRIDKPDFAVAAYREALRLTPKLAAAENNLGAVYERQGKMEEALACYRRALAALPGFPDARNNLVRLSRELGRPSGIDSTAAPPAPAR